MRAPSKAMAENRGDELARRHRVAATTVSALITFTLLLVALAYAGVRFRLPAGLLNPTFYGALWIVILILGLGAIALRRTRFNAMRLQDVAAYQGASGLVRSLHKTTVLVACIGGAIGVIGFLLAVRSGWPSDMLKAGVIAVAILLYAYPRRSAWERVAAATQRPGGLAAEPPTEGTTA